MGDTMGKAASPRPPRNEKPGRILATGDLIVFVKNMRTKFFLYVGCCLFPALVAEASPCSSLTRLIIPNTAITSAVDLPAGAFALPGAARSLNLPEFCRVIAVSRPTYD